VPDQLSLHPKRTLDEALMRLDQDIRRFRIDFERFFSGNLPIPPDQMRINIQNQIKELRTEHMKAVAHRFRFNSLEAKFNALMVLYNRRLRESEMGPRGRQLGEAVETGLDPEAGVIIHEKPSTASVEALFKGLYAHSETGPRADFDKFQAYLEEQARQIRKKTGCSEVSFRVAAEQGKLKLKAKPIRPDTGVS
jgi:hypothetical protein